MPCADKRDALDPRLGEPQQGFATQLQGLPSLVDRDRFLEGNIAALEAAHDGLELGERFFERQAGDVAVFGGVLRGFVLCFVTP